MDRTYSVYGCFSAKLRVYMAYILMLEHCTYFFFLFLSMHTILVDIVKVFVAVVYHLFILYDKEIKVTAISQL